MLAQKQRNDLLKPVSLDSSFFLGCLYTLRDAEEFAPRRLQTSRWPLGLAAARGLLTSPEPTRTQGRRRGGPPQAAAGIFRWLPLGLH